MDAPKWKTDAEIYGAAQSLVELERKKYVEEKQAKEQQESEIDRRLNHGDKGAI